MFRMKEKQNKAMDLSKHIVKNWKAKREVEIDLGDEIALVNTIYNSLSIVIDGIQKFDVSGELGDNG